MCETCHSKMGRTVPRTYMQIVVTLLEADGRTVMVNLSCMNEVIYPCAIMDPKDHAVRVRRYTKACTASKIPK